MKAIDLWGGNYRQAYDDLSQQYQWIGQCVNKIDVTNVGTQHDLTDLLKPVDFVLPEDGLLIEY